MKPAAVHYGLAEGIQAEREQILLQAYARHPERFVGKLPVPPSLPGKAWINPPRDSCVSLENDPTDWSDWDDFLEDVNLIAQQLGEEVRHQMLPANCLIPIDTG